MTLQQLRYLCEIVDRGLSVSRAAAALHTSQPGMSRQVQALERELGVVIFRRSKRRILGVTEPGEEALAIARKVVRDAEGLRHLGRDYFGREGGTLTVTTSHTHARYVLPDVIQAFTARYPKVRLTLRQGSPAQVAQWVATGDADLFICSSATREIPGLVLLPCYDQHKIVLAPRRHALARLTRPLRLADLARHPLITYESDFSTHSQVMRAFEDAELTPNIILSATDVDVMKAYVKRGMGIAIMAALAYDKKDDTELTAIPARHLFQPNKIYVGIKRDAHLRRYALDFIALFAPGLSHQTVLGAIEHGAARV